MKPQRAITTEPTGQEPGRRASNLDGRARRVTGWCGIGMVAAILVNGPLSQVVQRIPSYWDAGAADTFSAAVSLVLLQSGRRSASGARQVIATPPLSCSQD